MITYKCKKCGQLREAKREIKAYRCKNCNTVQNATLPENLVLNVNNEAVNNTITQEVNETPKDINIKTEQVNVEVPKIAEQTTQINQPVNPAFNQQNVNENKVNGLSEDTLTKGFSTVDTIMKGKTKEWDVTSKEEKLLGEQWASYLNEKYPKVTSEQGKLLVASASTVAVYLPRIFLYVKALYDQKKTKQKTETKTEEPENKIEEIYDTTKSFPDEKSEREKEAENWLNKKPTFGG